MHFPNRSEVHFPSRSSDRLLKQTAHSSQHQQPSAIPIITEDSFLDASPAVGFLEDHTEREGNHIRRAKTMKRTSAEPRQPEPLATKNKFSLKVNQCYRSIWMTSSLLKNSKTLTSANERGARQSGSTRRASSHSHIYTVTTRDHKAFIL